MLARLCPFRDVTGEEYDRLTVMFSLMEPVYSSNNQWSWTDVYQLGERVYYMNYIPGGTIEIQERLDD